MTPGYDAGGMWLHDPPTAVRSLARLGFQAVAIRSRGGILNPFDDQFELQWRMVTEEATVSQCRLVVDLEAAFVLDAHCRAHPSLCCPNDGSLTRLLRWQRTWIEAAGQLPGTVLTFCSGGGNADASDDAQAQLDQLAERVNQLQSWATDVGVTLALRPQAGHLIDSVAAFERLRHWLPVGSHDGAIALAADTHEMMLAGEWPLSARLQRNQDCLAIVYLADFDGDRISAGSGENRSPIANRRDTWLGDGDLALPRIVDSLGAMGFDGPVIIRTEGHAEAGLAPAEQAAREWKSAATA